MEHKPWSKLPREVFGLYGGWKIAKARRKITALEGVSVPPTSTESSAIAKAAEARVGGGDAATTAATAAAASVMAASAVRPIPNGGESVNEAKGMEADEDVDGDESNHGGGKKRRLEEDADGSAASIIAPIEELIGLWPAKTTNQRSFQAPQVVWVLEK